LPHLTWEGGGCPGVGFEVGRGPALKAATRSLRAVISADDPPVLELRMGNVAGGGGCVAHDADGRVVFVRHALPGELVRARITSETSKFRRADAIEILEPSPDRVAAPCPYAGPGRCGGCDFQHVSLRAQRDLKAFRVREQLQRVAGIERAVEVEAVGGDLDGLGWRTRIRLAVDGQGMVGFRAHRSHELVAVANCAVAVPAVMETGIFDTRWPGAEQTEVMTGEAEGKAEALVTVTARKRGTHGWPDVKAGLVVNGTAVRPPHALQAVVHGTSFRVSPGVFWQAHVGAAAALSEAVASVLDAQRGDSVVDLYAGAGLFSVLLAQTVGAEGTVLAVERDRRACADARHNAKGLGQLKVKEASVTTALVQNGIGHPDLLVLDPPREGTGTAVMRAIAEGHRQLRKVAYVSCDAGSFSRDVRVLFERGWTMTSLRAFDLFPMTEHVELVAGLEAPPS
jgi:tRNA/tmRNA/rRNA uracil-C5-methylase (TrmA/RlmC/RlmD family)